MFNYLTEDIDFSQKKGRVRLDIVDRRLPVRWFYENLVFQILYISSIWGRKGTVPR